MILLNELDHAILLFFSNGKTNQYKDDANDDNKSSEHKLYYLNRTNDNIILHGPKRISYICSGDVSD